jgi:hypothetical protein
MSDFTANADRLLELAGAIFSSSASENDVRELDTLLLIDEVSRRYYLNYCLMHVALRVESRARRAVAVARSQIKTDIIDLTSSGLAATRGQVLSSPPTTCLLPAFSGMSGFYASGWPVAYLIAMVVSGIGILIGSLITVSPSRGQHVLRDTPRCPTDRLLDRIRSRSAGLPGWSIAGGRVQGSELRGGESKIRNTKYERDPKS